MEVTVKKKKIKTEHRGHMIVLSVMRGVKADNEAPNKLLSRLILLLFAAVCSVVQVTAAE